MEFDKNISPIGWYIASYVLRFVELAEAGNDDPEQKFLAWENTILIEAASIDEAFDKVLTFSSRETTSYRGGKKGVNVQWIFEGITELLPVYEKIEDGSELMYREYQRKLKNIRKRVRPKDSFVTGIGHSELAD